MYFQVGKVCSWFCSWFNSNMECKRINYKKTLFLQPSKEKNKVGVFSALSLWVAVLIQLDQIKLWRVMAEYSKGTLDSSYGLGGSEKLSPAGDCWCFFSANLHLKGVWSHCTDLQQSICGACPPLTACSEGNTHLTAHSLRSKAWP